MSDKQQARTMPVWLGVGVAVLLVAVILGLSGGGPIFGVLLLVGLFATAYGVGQYMKERPKQEDTAP